MPLRFRLLSRWMPIVLLTIASGGGVASGALAAGGNPHKQHGAGSAPIHIEVQDGQKSKIATTAIHPPGSAAPSAALSFEREYQPGDRIVITGPQRVAVRLDRNMPECVLYLAGPSQGSLDYEIPYGRAEQQTGSAYAPESFSGKSHTVAARVIAPEELAGLSQPGAQSLRSVATGRRPGASLSP